MLKKPDDAEHADCRFRHESPRRVSRPRVLAAAASIVALSVTIAACGSSGSGVSAGSQPVASVVALKGADRQAQLVKLARQEGSLTWYVSLAGPIISDLEAGFHKEYPFLKISHVALGSNDLLTKTEEEGQTGRNQWDLAAVSAKTELVMRARGLDATFNSPATTKLPSDYVVSAKGGESYAAGSNATYFSFGYNSKLVPANDVPTNWSGLLNSGTGKIAISNAQYGAEWVGLLIATMGQAKAVAYLKSLKATGRTVVESTNPLAVSELINGGQVASSPVIYRDHVAQEAAKGGPIKWSAMPLVGEEIGMNVIDAHAPHPAAAMLLMDFILGPQGQAIFARDGYATPANAGATLGNAKAWNAYRNLNLTTYTEELNEWTNIFNQTFPG